MTYYRSTQSTHQGHGPAHYINNATVAVGEAGNYEVFYGNDIVLQLNVNNDLVIIGAGGTLAILTGLSRRSVRRMAELLERRYS